MAFAFFALVLFSSFDLMKHGFWTTYNRSFGTIKHVHREFKNSPNIINVDYSYLEYGVQKKGSAILLHADINTCRLFDRDFGIFSINSSDPSIRSIKLLPSDSGSPLFFENVHIKDLKVESLNLFLKNKIVKGKISANRPFFYNEKKVTEIEFDLDYSPQVYQLPIDSTEIKKVLSQIQLKRLELTKIKRANQSKFIKRNTLLKNHDSLLNRLKIDLGIYQRNKIEKALQEVRKSIQRIQSKGLGLSDTSVLEFEIKELESQLLVDNALYFSGVVETFKML